MKINKMGGNISINRNERHINLTRMSRRLDVIGGMGFWQMGIDGGRLYGYLFQQNT